MLLKLAPQHLKKSFDTFLPLGCYIAGLLLFYGVKEVRKVCLGDKWSIGSLAIALVVFLAKFRSWCRLLLIYGAFAFGCRAQDNIH